VKKQRFDSGCDKSKPMIHHNRVGNVKMSPIFLRSQVPGKRILCVDDEILRTRLCGEILERQGYSVALCHYPLEALRYNLSLYDLAIVDVRLTPS
jgi:PleD family two-component response regulator